MAQILKSTFCPISISQSNTVYPIFSESVVRKNILALKICRRRFRVCCAVQDGDKLGSSEEPPESLFMKELKRRGMTPTSLLEDTKRSNYDMDDELKVGEDDRNSLRRNIVSDDYDKKLFNQRERSMALNSEGLEGLVPRAKLLLTIGGTFFLAFWPQIVLTVSIFTALYLFFGASFVHDGTDTPLSSPPYVDPYALLEDQRISQIVSRVN